MTLEREIKIVGAIVGIDGVKKALAQLLKPDTYFAASLNDAKDWLVAHATR